MQFDLIAHDATAQTVLKHMELSLDYFKRDTSLAFLIPFLHTYALVTRRVIQADEKERIFSHSEALRKLDVCFAQLYFDPLEVFLRTGVAPSPWKTYVEYCTTKHPRAFLATLLGINAHINGDLPVALALTQYQHKTEFDLVDRLLAEVVPELMHFLAAQFHDLQATGAKVFPKFTQQEFSHLILGWRHQAWENARLMNAQNIDHQRQRLNQQTEAMAEQLMRVFHHPLRSVFYQQEWRRLKVSLNENRFS